MSAKSRIVAVQMLALFVDYWKVREDKGLEDRVNDDVVDAKMK